MDEAVRELVAMGIPPDVAAEVIRQKRQEKFNAETGTTGGELPPGLRTTWPESAMGKDRPTLTKTDIQLLQLQGQNDYLLTLMHAMSGDPATPYTPATNQALAKTGKTVGGQGSLDPAELYQMMQSTGPKTLRNSLPSPGVSRVNAPAGPTPTLTPQTPLNTQSTPGSRANFLPRGGFNLGINGG